MQELIFAHFDIEDRCVEKLKIFKVSSTMVFRFGILTHCYDKFSKADFAALSQKIAAAALEGEIEKI